MNQQLAVFLLVFLALSRPALAEGGLDRDQISTVVNEHMSEVRKCFDDNAPKGPQPSKEVRVKFFIDRVGAVSSAIVTDSSLKIPAVEQCLTEKAKAWKFPEPVGHTAVQVSYPFIFERVK